MKKSTSRHCSACGLPGHTKASHKPSRRNPQYRTTAKGVVYPLRGTDGPGGPYDSLKTKKPPFNTALRYLGEAKAKQLYPRRYAARLKANAAGKASDERRQAEASRKFSELAERKRRIKDERSKRMANLRKAEAKARKAAQNG